MKKVILKIDDNIYEKFIFILKNLKINGVEIEEEYKETPKIKDLILSI